LLALISIYAGLGEVKKLDGKQTGE
jgi:hypothetical protein